MYIAESSAGYSLNDRTEHRNENEFFKDANLYNWRID